MSKILLISHKMNLGGTEKALLSFLNALEEKQISVTLFLLERGGKLEKEIPQWVQVIYYKDFESIKPLVENPLYLTILHYFKTFQWFKMLQFSWIYTKIKLTGNWDYIYQFVLKEYPFTGTFDKAIAFAGPFDFITYLIYKKVDAQEKIQWIHFDVSQVIHNKNFGNKYYPYFQKIFCVSENAKSIFDNYFPQFQAKTFVFKNIVSSKELEKKANNGETFNDNYKGKRIVTLGRLSIEKGQQMIPSIVKRLKEEGLDFKWYLIGDGKLKANLEQQIKENNIENQLILLGSKLNPYRYLKECDLYVQTSLHEGYCLTIHEAKVFNRPVITTNVASASNLIVDQEDGLIVPIDEGSICQGISELLRNESKLKSFEKSLLAKDTSAEINKLNQTGL
jgi:glycosyltransferase involved in cell wall biosynthesis